MCAHPHQETTVNLDPFLALTGMTRTETKGAGNETSNGLDELDTVHLKNLQPKKIHTNSGFKKSIWVGGRHFLQKLSWKLVILSSRNKTQTI